MSQFAETTQSTDIHENLESLKEKVTSVKLDDLKAQQVTRVTVDIDSNTSLLDILQSSKQSSKIYWSGRNGEFESAGFGEALILAAENPDGIENVIRQARMIAQSSDGAVRIYGGIRFPWNGKNGANTDWKHFGAARFVVPRIEIVKNSNRTQLVCNLTARDFGDTARFIDEFANELEDSEKTEYGSEIISRTDLPTYDGWTNAINSILSDFKQGEIEKIVLARQTTIEFKNECDAPRILKKLSAATPSCYHFYFEPHKGTSFLGASPEQLYFRQDRNIASEALAGTRPRGDNSESDERFGQELLKSEKELREHKYVVDNIRAAFSSFCENYNVQSDAALLKLAQVQHLRTQFSGKLLPGISDSDIIMALHPTSAVGGFPSSAAQSRISRYEEFDRGWYAGAVGWLSKNAAEMAVAIRSGLIRGKELKLHSGAGIISGSTSEGEWAEIESKIVSFLGAVSG